MAERKKKTKPKFQLGRFLWKARVNRTRSTRSEASQIVAKNLTNSIKSRKCRQLTLKKAILYLFCNVARLIKIQFDELVSFHSISYLSVVSSMRFKCVFFSRKHPQKIGGIVISDKSDLTKIMSP